jgi:hypothetical protein
MATFEVKDSVETYSSSLGMFIQPGSSSDTERIDSIHYQPISQITPESSVLEFNIPGTSSSYIDLQSLRLHVKLRIVKENGKPITQRDKVGLINLPLQTIWSQLDLSLQNQIVNPNVGQNYAYKSYLDVLLKTDPQLLQAQLTSQLYYVDDAGFMDSLAKPERTNDNGDIIEAESPPLNSGLRYRSVFTDSGNSISLEGPLYTDLCQQNRYILNGVPLRIKLWRHKDSFCLMSESSLERYRIEITDAFLKLCCVKVNPGILIGHSEVIKSQPALYPFMKSDIKAFSIPKGQFNITLDNLYQGLVPCNLTIGLVSSEAYSGFYNKNPFNFHHYDCNYCGFFVDSQSVPGQPFQPNYSTNSWVSSYLSLFHKGYQQPVNSISLTEYPKGYCIYHFKLQEEGGPFHFPVQKRGHTKLELKFSQPLPESVTLIAYARFPNIMTIDNSRNVFV